MGGDIRIVDPATVPETEPVTGLVERTPLRAADYRLIVLRIDDASPWHRRDGTVYGWVRAGSGRVMYSPERTAALDAGDFLRIPAETVHRYTTADERLECLAVVAGGTDATRADPPSTIDEEVEPDVVGPDGLVPTVESPDLRRETPFPDADVLLMRVRAAGGAAAGWHHHGDNVYFGYAVDGPSETEYGPRGDRVARIEIGECFHVPPGLIHRDTNPTNAPHTGIIWLCGGEPWVVNVDSPNRGEPVGHGS